MEWFKKYSMNLKESKKEGKENIAQNNTAVNNIDVSEVNASVKRSWVSVWTKSIQINAVSKRHIYNRNIQ